MSPSVAGAKLMVLLQVFSGIRDLGAGDVFVQPPGSCFREGTVVVPQVSLACPRSAGRQSKQQLHRSGV